MSDTNLNITVTTDSAALQNLITKLQSGNMTVAQYNKATRDLRAVTIAGSQAQKDLGDVMAQVAKQTKSAEAQENSLGNIIRENRKERRLYMFAVTEGLSAINSATGGQNEFAKSITAGAGAVFGMKFALDAMGMSAKAAWPVAIIVAAWTVISGILAGEKKATEDLNAELEKQFKLKVSLGLISPNQQLAEQGKRVSAASADVILAQGGIGTAQRNVNSAISGMDIALAKDALKQANLVLQQKNTILLEQEEIYKNLYDVAVKSHTLEVDAVEVTGPSLKKQEEDKIKRLDHLLELQRDLLAYEQTQNNRRKRITGADTTTIGGFSMSQGGTDERSFLERQKVVAEVVAGKTKTEAKEITGYQRALAGGFDAVGQSIEVQLIGKLHEATSIFQVFTNAVISGLVRIAAQMASQALFGGLMKALGIVAAPVTGGASLAAVSQAGFDFATAGGAAARMGQGPRFSGSGYGVNGGPIVLETRIKGSDLVLVQAKAGISRNGRIM